MLYRIRKRYLIGIDVGLMSVGLAAIEVDESGFPIRILNLQSVIHDGGIDPQAGKKKSISRKAVSGIARRTRRMRNKKVARLRQLDLLLEELGFPIVEPDSLDARDAWRVRAELVDSYILDDEIRKEDVSIALRHIARHRGWRNPYSRVESLLIDTVPSKQYEELKSKAEQKLGRKFPGNPTPAEIVCRVWEEQGETARLRTSRHKDKNGKVVAREGLLPVKLMQGDNAEEIRRIFKIQRIDDATGRRLLKAVFKASSPKGSAAQRVGRDALAPELPRALKASMAFQEYRIANVLTNLVISVKGVERKLTVEEKRRVFALLSSDKRNDVTWIDVAEELGVERNQIQGVGRLTADGEERISSMPPRNVTVSRIRSVKSVRKKLVAWWKSASVAERETMVEILSSAVDIDRVREHMDYESASTFIDSLDDEELVALDSMNLPSGRAAYSIQTLNRLTERMLNTDDDLHEARKSVFGVGDDWKPPVDAIGVPVGNPSVDRVLKIVNRYLLACQRRWGNPQSVQIEHVREGFSSVAKAKKTEKAQAERTQYRNDLKEQIRREKIDKIRESDIRRWEAVQRQNGECLYCGRRIDFSTCEMDHIVPRKGAGSTNTRVNLAAVCAVCNKLKGDTAFSVWAGTRKAIAQDTSGYKVSLRDAIERVKAFNFDQSVPSPRDQRVFRQAVISRLEQTESDPAIDNRSIESVAWMADELHRRIEAYFNRDADTSKNTIKTKVWVFRGRLTALARKTCEIEGRIHFAGEQRKTRLDRRHHAVDAAVIAMLNHSVAQTLVERDSLRLSQWITRRPETWTEYPFVEGQKKTRFEEWLCRMDGLLDLLNNALDADRVHVIRNQRLALGNSQAHDAIIRKMEHVELLSSMDSDLIRRASTPALYYALTRLPDYSPENGLPENHNREIVLNGRRIRSTEMVDFFASGAAQIAVRNGSAEIGNAIHHMRIYRYRKNGKTTQEYMYGMIRVFQVDLIHASSKDLFTVQLPPQSVSMRYGDRNTVQAIQEKRAEYLGYVVSNDEILIDFEGVQMKDSEKIGAYARDFSGTASEFAQRRHWVVVGSDVSKLVLRPAYLAEEGLGNLESDRFSEQTRKVIGKGWVVAINVLAKYRPVVIRRNALGEPRFRSNSGMPISWRWNG